MAASAPAASASIVLWTVELRRSAATMMIGVGHSCMMRRVASMPFMPGRLMSMQITSGFSRGITARALSAVSTV